MAKVSFDSCFLIDFELLSTSGEVALVYAELFRDLARSKSMIGGNNLWIAAYSIVANLPLVTNDTREFVRVKGLKVLSY
jgi:tRNA(fMet)-specific endonuclease VapC